MGCKFCCTGSQKMIRNISTGEIIMQFLLTKDLIDDWKKDQKKIKNIVFMGMGEPLLNFEQVAKAIKIFTSSEGLEISRRHITVSTCGIVPNIKKCAQESKINLALSLHAVANEFRSSLMPINKKFSLQEVLNACREYSILTKTKITFEYILIDGVNDSEKEARKLVRLVSGINSKINLIPFNSWEGCSFSPSKENQISKFANVLKQKGFEILIRRSKGGDVNAACGQLKLRK
jgi:23S rRNA (adenine2503-C2)-methyltransferase